MYIPKFGQLTSSAPWGQINNDDNLRQLGRGSLERILLRRDGHPSLAVVLDEVTWAERIGEIDPDGWVVSKWNMHA